MLSLAVFLRMKERQRPRDATRRPTPIDVITSPRRAAGVRFVIRGQRPDNNVGKNDAGFLECSFVGVHL